MGEGKQNALQVDFDTRIRLEFHGSNITSDAGLIAYRELEDALELTTAVENSELKDSRTEKNTRHTLSCHRFEDNQVRLQLFALAYNLANFLRLLALPNGFQDWSLTTLREKLIKIGAKIVRHARYVTFQMAEVAMPRKLFREILRRIARLKTKRLSLALG